MSSQAVPPQVNYFSLFDHNIVDKCFRGIHLMATTSHRQEQDEVIGKFLDDLVVAERMSCATCGGVDFPSRQDQVLHYKHGWHCHNLRRKLSGKEPIDLATYSSRRLSDDDESSQEEEEEVEEVQGGVRLYFRNELGCLFSVHRRLVLDRKETAADQLDLVARIESLPSMATWAVLLLGGGRFAGAVFQRHEVLVHKSFQRYVVRRKQGTYQSSHDNGRHATSGGASLRRYNELALKEDCRQLLHAWKNQLDRCQLIFYRLPKRHGHEVLFAGKAPPFSSSDSRLRSIPFATGRPSFQEVVTAHRKLSSIECHGASDSVEHPGDSGTRQTAAGTEKQPRPHTEARKTSRQPRNHPPRPPGRGSRTTRGTARPRNPVRNIPRAQEQEDLRRRDLRNVLFTACKTGDCENLEKILEEEEDLAEVVNEPFGSAGATFLHVASKAGHFRVVSCLLRLGADPTVPDHDGKFAYDVADSVETKEAFHKFLGKSEEQERAEAEVARRRVEEEARQHFASLPDAEKVSANKSGGSGGTRCCLCGISLRGVTPFEYLDFRFCQLQCLKEHRNKS